MNKKNISLILLFSFTVSLFLMNSFLKYSSNNLEKDKKVYMKVYLGLQKKYKFVKVFNENLENLLVLENKEVANKKIVSFFDLLSNKHTTIKEYKEQKNRYLLSFTYNGKNDDGLVVISKVIENNYKNMFFKIYNFTLNGNNISYDCDLKYYFVKGSKELTFDLLKVKN